jgi:uncharacterized protein with NAD-binding domain and iron-sulfur cluster
MKRRIVIIGGGMAGLAAAFDLSRTQALRDQFDVTIYQLGWRLGGKAASGRLPDGRIVEHGLHVWFGCYENAFELVRAAYEAWNPHKDQAITKWEDAFEKQRFTVIGSGDQANFSGIFWPQASGSPGDGGEPLAFWPCITWLLRVIDHQFQAMHPFYDFGTLQIPVDIAVLLAEAEVKIDIEPDAQIAGTSPSDHQISFGLVAPFDKSLTATWKWADSFTRNSALRTEKQLRGFARFLRFVSAHVWDDKNFGHHKKSKFLCELIDVGTALVKGVVIGMQIEGASVAELDALDFRDWLCGVGAQRDAVFGSSIVKSLYNTTFQYLDGDKRRPSLGAGSGAQVALRLFGGYKDAFLYETTAGLGEVVVAPIYGALRKWGVKFQFFHKLKRIELNEAQNGVEKVHFDRQVDLSVETYKPTFDPDPRFGNLECWPEAPLWEQIKNGRSLEGLDLESCWCDQKTGDVVLSKGADFDEAVLAVSIGALKPTKDAPGPCAELLAAGRRFKKMTDAASLVPTVSLQAWCTRTLKDMGWRPPDNPFGADKIDFPMVNGPALLNIWADRTVVLDRENWGEADAAPASLQYLCDVFETTLYKAPPSCVEVPKIAKACARRLAVDWLEQKSQVLWPPASPGAPFDWNLLFDAECRTGEDRIDYQVIKANVDPWACCAGSPAGSTRWRLPADGSRFAHLYLAGAWIDSGFNVECIEAAVMSGRQAARAIVGTGEVIDGEAFLHFERSLGGLLRELAIGVEAAAEHVLGLALSGGKPLSRSVLTRRR